MSPILQVAVYLLAMALTAASGYILIRRSHAFGWRSLRWLPIAGLLVASLLQAAALYSFVTHNDIQAVVAMLLALLAVAAATLGSLILPANPANRPSATSLTRNSGSDRAASRQSALLSAIPQAVIAVDKIGVVTFWNEGAEEMYGWTSEEAVGRYVSDLLFAGQDEGLQTEIRETLAHGGTFQKEFTVSDRNGRLVPIELTISPLLDAQGRLTGSVGISRDVTERLKRRQELLDSRERCQALASAAFEAIVLVEDGRVVEANEQACRMFGYTLDEARGRHFADFVAPEDREIAMSRYQNPDGTPHEYRCLRKDGSVIEVEVRLRALQYRGRLTGIIAAQDISYRRQAERQIEESERCLRAVLEYMPVMMAAMSAEQRVLVWNKECERVTGYTSAEMTADPAPQERLFPDPAYRQEVRELWKKDRGNYRDREVHITCKDGSVRTILWSNVSAWVPIPGWYSWAIGADVTELRRAERALRLSLERYRLVISTAGSIIMGLDSELRVVEWNQAAERLTGRLRSEAIGTEFVTAFVPETCQDDVRTAFTHALRGKPVGSLEHRLWTGDGALRLVSWNLSSLPDTAGMPPQIICMGRDVTAERSQDEAVRESESRFRTMADSAPALIWVTDSAGEAVFFNTTWLEFRGRRSEQELGRQWLEGIHEEDRELLKTRLSADPGRPLSVEAEVRLRRYDGEYRRLLLRAAPRIEASGECIGYVATGIDITDMRKIRADLESSLSLLQATLESTATGILVVDRSGRVVICNQRFQKMWRISDTLLATRDDHQLLDFVLSQLSEPEQFLAKVRELYDSPTTESFDVLRFKDGRVFERSSKPQSIAGVSVGRVWSFHDVTERHRAEERLLRINETLLHLESSPSANISAITALCGELLHADCALYNRLVGNMLYSVGQWHTPPDYNPVDQPDGHICYDVIRSGSTEPLLIRDLSATVYQQSDPNVAKYGLKTYSGYPVRCGEQVVGSLCVVYTQSADLTNADTTILGILAAAIGAEEERLRTTEALVQSEAKFRQLFQRAPIAYQSLDESGHILEVNETWLTTLGYSREDVLGRWFGDFLTPACAEKFRHTFDQFKSAGVVVGVEFEMVCKHGNTRLVSFNGKVGYNDLGQLLQTHCVFIDITEQRQAQQALAASEERYRSLVELSPLGVAVIVDGGILFANRALACMLGAPDATGLVGRRFADLVHPDCRAEVSEHIRAAVDGEAELPPHEHRLLRFDGTVVEIESRAARNSLNGRPVAQVIVADITERKRIDREKSALEEQLRRAQRLETIGTLAAGIAHDFNNMLVPVIGYTEMTLEDLVAGSAPAERLHEVLKASYRARDLVAQILAFSRQQVGERQVVQLENIIVETLARLRSVLPTRVVVTFEHGELAPSVLADAGQLQQVLLNLAFNSADAMEADGSFTLALSGPSADKGRCQSCHRSLPGPHLHLSVRDTGRGMDRQTLKRIFDPFFTTKAGGEASGLGLAVSHGIITQHGGHICAESEPGKGSEFHIYLPACSPRAAAWSEKDGSGSVSVLLIDGEASEAEAASWTLERAGCRVTVCVDTSEAAERLRDRARSFQLLLVHYRMIVDNAETILDDLHRLRPDIPVVVAAENPQMLFDGTTLLLPCSAVVRTPLLAHEIERTIRSLLSSPSPVS
ncbi:MAG: PAS domain S-box protein [Candidatus Zixiibacteriota bacterium]